MSNKCLCTGGVLFCSLCDDQIVTQWKCSYCLKYNTVTSCSFCKGKGAACLCGFGKVLCETCAAKVKCASCGLVDAGEHKKHVVTSEAAVEVIKKQHTIVERQSYIDVGRQFCCRHFQEGHPQKMKKEDQFKYVKREYCGPSFLVPPKKQSQWNMKKRKHEDKCRRPKSNRKN